MAANRSLPAAFVLLLFCGGALADEAAKRSSSVEAAQQFAQVREVADKLWQTRLQVNEGRVRLRTRCLKDAAHPIREQAVNTREIVFRDEYLFVKRTRSTPARDHHYYVVLGPGYSFDWQSNTHPVNVNYLQPLEIGDARVFHPRTLGLFASSLATYYVFHEHANLVGLSEDAMSIAVKEGQTDAHGNELLYVKAQSRRSDSDMSAEYWYSVKQHHMPIRVVVSSKGGQLVDMMETSLMEAEVTGGTVYFPDVAEYTRHRHGDLVKHEKTKTVEADFATPVNDAAFELSSIDTGVRAEAFVDRGKIRPIVDGQIAENAPSSAPLFSERPRISTRAWILLANTTVAMGVLVWLILRRHRAGHRL